MTQTSLPARGRLGASLSGFDPLRTVWALLCNVKFALVLVGSAVVCGLLGIVIPQLPAPMRSNPAARDAWLELRRTDFGFLTDPMYRLGLFDVFHAWWFNALWAVIIIAVAVSTVSRLRPIARSVHHPPLRVNDRYFEVAHNRASFTHAGGAASIENLLRGRRYTVERVEESDGTTYLFAKRFLLTQYGTVISHLALIMLMVGALLTRFVGFSNTLALAEQSPAAPVFSNPGPGQIFIHMDDAVRKIDDSGNIVDFRSFLEVRRGDEIVHCVATVNDPCKAFGYKFHQAAFFNDIGRLQVLDPTGAVVYSDVVDFDNESTAVPVLKVEKPDGTLLFNEALPQLATDTGADGVADDIGLGVLNFVDPDQPGQGIGAPIAWQVADNQLRVAVESGDTPINLTQGKPEEIGGYLVTFVQAVAVPAITILDMPGATDDRTIVQMPTDQFGDPYFVVSGISDEPVVLEQGNSVTTPSGYQFTFDGRVEAAGIEVKRDPGDTFIWIGVILALAGLAMTFYVPRRRLWVKVTPERTYMAGIAERTTRFARELRMMGAQLGADDALEPADINREDDW